MLLLLDPGSLDSEHGEVEPLQTDTEETRQHLNDSPADSLSAGFSLTWLKLSWMEPLF